jgi:WD40 repeat protein
MGKSMTRTWRGIWLALVISAGALFFSMQTLSSESVHAELVRLQDQTGLTIAWVDNNVLTLSFRSHTAVSSGVMAVDFKERATVPLKDSLSAFRLEGFRFDNFPRFAADDFCWSHDGSMVAATMLYPPETSLGIFVLSSKLTQAIEPRADHRMHFTSQCWSPDDKQVAYELEGSVKVYHIGADTSTRIRVLAKGTDVTWSPDGNWVAFRDHDTYYAIHPDGNSRKELFRNHWGRAVSALYWSPDSRIVAYVRELGFLQGGALDAEVNQLRARRLDDGSDYRLCPDSVDWYANYHWISTSELKVHP